MKVKAAISLVSASALLACSANAATINPSAAWPTAPDAETVDVHSLTAVNGRGISSTRKIRQTFQTDSTFDVAKFVFSFANWSGTGINIRVFEVSDIEAGTWSAGAQVGGTITISGGTPQTGDHNIEITLDAGEQFSLAQRNTGSQGYGIELESIGTSTAGGWRHAFDGTDHVAGRYYNETNAGQALNRDMGLAIIAVPEPSSLALLGLGGLLIARRRRV